MKITHFMTGESSPSRKSTQKLTASIRLTSCASVAGTERGAYLLYTDQSRPRNQGLNPHNIASSYSGIFDGQSCMKDPSMTNNNLSLISE